MGQVFIDTSLLGAASLFSYFNDADFINGGADRKHGRLWMKGWSPRYCGRERRFIPLCLNGPESKVTLKFVHSSESGSGPDGDEEAWNGSANRHTEESA